MSIVSPSTQTRYFFTMHRFSILRNTRLHTVQIDNIDIERCCNITAYTFVTMYSPLGIWPPLPNHVIREAPFNAHSIRNVCQVVNRTLYRLLFFIIIGVVYWDANIRWNRHMHILLCTQNTGWKKSVTNSIFVRTREFNCNKLFFDSALSMVQYGHALYKYTLCI